MYFNKRMGLAPSSHVTFTISSSDHALLLGHRKLYCVELCSWLILGWKTAAHSLTSSLGCLLWQSWSWGKEKSQLINLASAAEDRSLWESQDLYPLKRPFQNYYSKWCLPHFDIQYTECQQKLWFCDIKLRLQILLFYEAQKNKVKKPHHRALLYAYGLGTHYCSDLT